MRALLAIAELRLRGAAAARLPWLALLAFAAGVGLARWAPGADLHARAASAAGFALAAAAATALVAVLVLAATTFSGEVRTGTAQTLLSTPLSRAALVAGGVAGQTVFGWLFVVALAAAASLGLDVGGLGTTHREPPRPMHAAEVLGLGPDGVAVLSSESPEVRARFRVPDGLTRGGDVRLRLAPRGQIGSSWDPRCVVEVAVARPGASAAGRRLDVKASVAFTTSVPLGELGPGDEADVIVRRFSGGYRLRFHPGSIEAGGGRELLAWNLVKAGACLLPLLALASAAGAAATARLGGGASLAVVLFLLFLIAGRDVLLDGAKFVVERAQEQAVQDAEHAGHAHAPGEHDDEAHDHSVRVTPGQVALARGALVGLRAVPEVDDFWRFDDIAEGRAVRARDVGRAWAAGLLPGAVLLAAAWLLVRRRELLPA